MPDLPHYVSVEPWEYSGDTEFSPIVYFKCPWLYGECHFYPSCDCETWDAYHYKDHGPGHEREHHAECWMEAWFKSGHGAAYIGDDYDDMQDDGLPLGMKRSGPIDVTFQYEYIEWEFTA